MLPCLSRRAAAATPQLLSVAPLAAPFNSTLTLVGANLSGPASGGGGASAPTVSVCGGRACAVLAHNATHVQCRMPMCSADANETTLLHVPPYGYAQPLGDTAVRGVLSVTAAVLASVPSQVREAWESGQQRADCQMLPIGWKLTMRLLLGGMEM